MKINAEKRKGMGHQSTGRKKKRGPMDLERKGTEPKTGPTDQKDKVGPGKGRNSSTTKKGGL